MAAKPSTPDPSPAESESAAPASGKSLIKRLFVRHWIPIVLVLSLLAHGLLVTCWPAAVRAKPETATEIDLGTFRFINNEKNARLAKAEFQLHVSLLLGTEKAGGNRLADKKYLVQQGVEELLRQAHAADFDDPTLAELKRQIQEKVNEAVEMRTVEAVIITKLETQDRVVPAKTSVASVEQGSEPTGAVRAVKASTLQPETQPAAESKPVEPGLAAGNSAG